MVADDAQKATGVAITKPYRLRMLVYRRRQKLGSPRDRPEDENNIIYKQNNKQAC